MTVSSLNRDFVIGFQQGSYGSVHALYHSFYASLVEFAEQLTLSQPEAHHITLEAFLKLYRMRGQFHTAENIRAFLYITVRNMGMAYNKAERQEVVGNSAPWYSKIADTADACNEEAARAAGIQQMRDELALLPDEYKTILEGIYYKKGTVPSVATQLQLSQVAVAKKRIQAIQLFREQLYIKGIFSLPLFVYFLAVSDQS